MAGRTLATLLAALLAAGLVVAAAHGAIAAASPAAPAASEAAPQAAPALLATPAAPLFVTADRCVACHNALVAPSGEDVSFGTSWQPSMMANSARDPYWQAAVRRETLEHPEAAAAIQDECSKCHMPMMRTAARAAGGEGEIFAHLPIGQAAGPGAVLAADGVSCSACHQVQPDLLGEEESFTGGFVIDTAAAPGTRAIFGPHAMDAGRLRVMHSAIGFVPTEATHLATSELCATCHTLHTHSRAAGQVVGELPEQVPYREWLHSGYAATTSCQDCHMPEVADDTAISAVLGQGRPALSRHAFRGGNFFMLRVFNRYRDELGVTATPHQLEAAVQRTLRHLETASATVAVERVELVGGRLEADVVVANLAGHKLPTAYPSRRAWLHLAVRDAAGRLVFESGAFRPDGSIAGNDNDADPARFEPHYAEITRAEQVQIYETILLDGAGRVTTGLLTGLTYGKDNRLLPAGFDKATANADIAVHGAATGDPDFTAGGDRVRYRIPIDPAAGPFTVEAALWYQPIGLRWAENLAAFDSFETTRFVRYYRSLAAESGVMLARDTATR